ncbi:SpoIIIAH-like family protein [Desulfuribacillus alkaliarsenatis]|uniref:Stage III sporulation protein AH n=1 Tax=Desulfuribacillus alkaliarsenatis TaxID=766136 RepID=A0A1E5G5J3_9FIRM|nr:SpoIIIAH-like family protein [Desulfuribacillus alkaliarsenatis]OEF98436.1 hypothetical protein BHF68_01815 [Desulfuribacillus alkaliarsenatis]
MSFFIVKKEKMLLSALMVFTLLILGYYVAGNLTQPVEIAVPTDVSEEREQSGRTDDNVTDNDPENQGPPGQVILYDSTYDDFVSFRLNRDFERSQMIDDLRITMASANVTPEEVAKAKSMYDNILKAASIEDDIEEIIMSLGFKDCVYSQTGEKAQIIVQADQVSPEQYLEILDIVSNKTGLSHRNIEVSYYN